MKKSNKHFNSRIVIYSTILLLSAVMIGIFSLSTIAESLGKVPDRISAEETQEYRESDRIEELMKHLRAFSLLIDKGLLTSNEDSHLRRVAKAKFEDAYQTLDKRFCGKLVEFLVVSRLLTSHNPVIDLEKYFDLHQLDLSKAYLRKANLSETILTEANLDKSYLYEADFSQSNMRKANLSYTQIFRANFAQANLSEASLFSASLYSANLNRVDLSKSDLRFVQINGGSLRDSYGLTAVNLHQADLRDATIEKARLIRANLSQANLKRAQLRSVLLVNANLTNTNFNEADLAQVIFKEANLSRASFRQAGLWQVNFTEANLSQANFNLAYLGGINFVQADLKQANLHQAYLGKADLSQAKNLDPMQVKSACYWQEALYSQKFTERLNKAPDLKVDCKEWSRLRQNIKQEA